MTTEPATVRLVGVPCKKWYRRPGGSAPVPLT